MSAARKQQILIGLGIFLSLTAIGFSFGGPQVEWFWQRTPYLAISFMLLAFLVVRFWLALEVERQKENIKGALLSQKENAENSLYSLLSEREKEVILLIVAGKSNQEIASTLFVSLSTVKTHINNIYKILEVNNRRAAIEKFSLKNKKEGRSR